jgi:hypothetical protein
MDSKSTTGRGDCRAQRSGLGVAGDTDHRDPGRVVPGIAETVGRSGPRPPPAQRRFSDVRAGPDMSHPAGASSHDMNRLWFGLTRPIKLNRIQLIGGAGLSPAPVAEGGVLYAV